MRATVELLEIAKSFPADHLAFASILAALAVAAFAVHKMAAVAMRDRRRED
jgi:hypothetical protein